VTNSIAISKEDKNTKLMKKKLWIGLMLIVIFSAAVVVELLIHK